MLITEHGDVKITDFGLSRLFTSTNQQFTHEVVTLWYRAPEILLGEDCYTPAIDIWSIGCIMYELAHKKPFVSGDSEIDQILKTV